MIYIKFSPDIAVPVIRVEYEYKILDKVPENYSSKRQNRDLCKIIPTPANELKIYSTLCSYREKWQSPSRTLHKKARREMSFDTRYTTCCSFLYVQ
jgi:hypothetical protein